MKNKPEKLKNRLSEWFLENTKIIAVSDDTVEIVTAEKDSFGEVVYCYVQKLGETYRVSDDGRLLFKLDPSVSDDDLLNLAGDIAAKAGIQLDEKHCELWVLSDLNELCDKVRLLAQIQAVISYLV